LYRFFRYCELLDSATSTPRSDVFTIITSARVLHIRCTGRWWVDYARHTSLLEDNVHSCRRRHGSPKVWHRTCVVFLTTHGHTMNYDVRGSKLADLMMSARRCVASSTVLTLTSTYSVSDVWRHSTLLTIPSSTSNGFNIKFLYLNHGPESS